MANNTDPQSSEQNPYEIREEAARIIGEDRVPTNVLADLLAQYGDSDPAQSEDVLTAQRRARFERVRSAYDAQGPDPTTPGAARRPARYALLSENEKCSHFLNYARSRADLEVIAASDLLNGWTAVTVFDLDELDGEQPPIATYDRVLYQGRELNVIHSSEELADGVPYRKLWLDTDPEKALDDAEFIEIDESAVELIEPAEEDERLAKAYDVAEIRTIVVFNTTPNP
jgi:hypothetical protein